MSSNNSKNYEQITVCGNTTSAMYYVNGIMTEMDEFTKGILTEKDLYSNKGVQTEKDTDRKSVV